MDQDATWYGVGLNPGDILLDGDPAPPHGKGHSSPLFSTQVYFGQTAGQTRIPLDTEVGLGSSDIVLDRDPAPPPTERGTAAPHFLAHFALARSPISATAELLLQSLTELIAHEQCQHCSNSSSTEYYQLECGPMPNLMVALPNTGGALCSTPQSLADAHY